MVVAHVASVLFSSDDCEWLDEYARQNGHRTYCDTCRWFGHPIFHNHSGWKDLLLGADQMAAALAHSMALPNLRSSQSQQSKMILSLLMRLFLKASIH